MRMVESSDSAALLQLINNDSLDLNLLQLDPNSTVMSVYSTVEEFHRVGEGYILTAIVIFGVSANVFSIIVTR